MVFVLDARWIGCSRMRWIKLGTDYPKNGDEFRLLIKLEVVVHRSIHWFLKKSESSNSTSRSMKKLTMNSESRNSENGTIDLYEFWSEFARFFGNDDSSCDGEITIEPRMPYTASVCLHTNLKIWGLATLWNRPDLCEDASTNEKAENVKAVQQVLLSSSGCLRESRRCSDHRHVASSVGE